MKTSKVLIMVGPILLLIGIGLIAGAMLPEGYTETFTIPGGPYYYAFESTTILGLSIEGEFEVDGLLETVTMYVMTPDQFDAYATLNDTDAELTVSGNSGTFDVSLDTTKAYIVFEHGLHWSPFDQDVTLTCTIHGTAVTYLTGGIALSILAVVLIIYGMRLSKKEAGIAPPQQQPAADVMTFDQQKPPGNP